MANTHGRPVRTWRTAMAAVGPLGVPAPVVAWWFEAADVYLRGGRLLIDAGGLAGKGQWNQMAATVTDARAVVDPAADRFASADLCYLACGLRFFQATADHFRGRSAEMLAGLKAASGWAARGAVAPDLFPGGTRAFDCRAFAVFIDATLAHPDLDPAADGRRDLNLVALAAAGPEYRRARAAAAVAVPGVRHALPGR